MADLEGSAIDKGVDRHGLSDIGGPLSVGGVSFLTPGTGLFIDFTMLAHIRTEQGFRDYLKFREEASKLAAKELVATCNSPVDLFLHAERDESLFEDQFLKFVTIRDQYSVVVGGSKESRTDCISPHRVLNEAEMNHIHRKNVQETLLTKLHIVRKYYAYRKGLLKLDFIKWNSDPEEVLKQIKESTRWSHELDDYDLQRGLEGHMKLLKRHVKLGSTSTSGSISEFENVALEEINSNMGSELDQHLRFRDQWLMQEYINRMKARNLARECFNQAENTGVILVEEFLPLRSLEGQLLPRSLPWNKEGQLLPRSLPQMKQRVKQSLESTMGYVHRQASTRVRALNLLLLGAFSFLSWNVSKS